MVVSWKKKFTSDARVKCFIQNSTGKVNGSVRKTAHTKTSSANNSEVASLVPFSGSGGAESKWRTRLGKHSRLSVFLR